MIVSEILDITVDSELANLAVGEKYKKGTSEEKLEAGYQLISYLNLGLIELSKRFTLRTEAVLLNLYPEVNIYTVRNPELIRVIDAYDATGKQLRFPDTVGDTSFDIKEVAYDTFLIPVVKESQVMLVAKYIVKQVEALADEIDIPLVMIDALCNYIAYKAYSSLGGNNKKDSDVYFARFEQNCMILASMGYNDTSEILGKNVSHRGFV